MTITVDAVYADGQLKLSEPIAVAEGTKVCVTLRPLETAAASEPDGDPLEQVIGICDEGPAISLATCHDQLVDAQMLGEGP